MYHGRFEAQKPQKSQKPKKKGKAGKIVLIVLAVVLLLLVVVGVVGYQYMRSIFAKTNYIEMPTKTYPTEVSTEPAMQAPTSPEQTEQADVTTEPTTVETTRPPMKPEDIINVLVMGDSSRAGEEARNADTMILVSLNTYTNTVTLTSILRDAFVKLPDYKGHECGRSKMTFCYNLGYQWGGGEAGGFEMTNLCLYNNFGIDVDYNVIIDFEHFINIIDYCGGVLIELTPQEADYLNSDTVYVKTPVTEGVNRLDGMAALCFARMRHAEGDNDSDITRTSRQRRLISALVEQFRYYDLKELKNLIEVVMPFITTTMDPDTMMGLVAKMLPMLVNLKIESGECPYADSKSRWGDMVDIFSDGNTHSVIRFDEALNKKHMRAITEGITE